MDEPPTGWAQQRAAGPRVAVSLEAVVAGPTGVSATNSAMPLPGIAAPQTPVRRPDPSVNRRAVAATVAFRPPAGQRRAAGPQLP